MNFNKGKAFLHGVDLITDLTEPEQRLSFQIKTLIRIVQVLVNIMNQLPTMCIHRKTKHLRIPNYVAYLLCLSAIKYTVHFFAQLLFNIKMTNYVFCFQPATMHAKTKDNIETCRRKYKCSCKCK